MSETTREVRLSEAFVKLSDTLVADYDVVDLLHMLMQECISILDTQAGGILLANRFGSLELVASTSERADLVEVMQLAAGSGPCIDCFTSGTPNNIADISESAATWPEFAAAALSQGFRSLYTTPLRLRGNVIGALNLFGTEIGALNEADAAAVRALAAVATIGVLQARLVNEKTLLAEQLQHALDSRILIEQAKGVLSEIGNLDMDAAFDALRGYARDHNLALRTVAENVVDRSLDILSTQRTSTG
ncbi:GAF and ANTAR domain-containing protein [Microbacterium panaciterrae]|uniref:GAF and ANTAR domain-containing protein n=1 Tax=Microbacterium panaciterrae TaxID=985759 RepID=A0ABP8PBP8_9MICO